METGKKQKKAVGYCLKGLTAAEIGKLLDVSPRTVQRWIKANRETLQPQPPPVKNVCWELWKRGISIKRICEKTGLSRSTVQRKIKAGRTKN
jgi:transposase